MGLDYNQQKWWYNGDTMSQLPSSNQTRLAGKSLNEMEASMGKSWNYIVICSLPCLITDEFRMIEWEKWCLVNSLTLNGRVNEISFTLHQWDWRENVLSKNVPVLNCETMDIEVKCPSISLNNFVLMVEQDVKPCIWYDL